jgi:hypothetical protein
MVVVDVAIADRRPRDVAGWSDGTRVSPARRRLASSRARFEFVSTHHVRSSSKSDAKAGIEGGPRRANCGDTVPIFLARPARALCDPPLEARLLFYPLALSPISVS